jgi:hypothetical protein
MGGKLARPCTFLVARFVLNPPLNCVEKRHERRRDKAKFGAKAMFMRDK